jgi:lia operon protein LiaG
MNNTVLRRIAIISAIVAVVGLGGAAILWLTRGVDLGAGGRWDGVAVDERETFSLESVEEILVSTASADVEIVNAGGASVAGSDRIEARLSGITTRKDNERVRRLHVQRDGGTLRIETGRTEIFDVSLASLGRRNLRLEVSLPEDFSGRLEIRTASGKVEIGDRRIRELAIRTVSGDIELAAVGADAVALKTTSGEARVERLESRTAVLSTVSGDFDVAGFIGSLQAESTSGTLEVEFGELAGDVEITSTSGDVGLTLPRNAGFGLEARSTSGDVTCRFPIEVTGAGNRGERNSIVGTVGTAGHRIRIKTVSGDIRVAY